MKLGTILPTKSSLLAGDAHAEMLYQKRERIGATIGGERRVVGGEVRWYTSDNEFAVVSRSLVIKWFEIRDGYEYSKR